MPMRARIGDNGGPPLDDYDGPPWGEGDPHIFLCWKRAHDAAWKSIPPQIAVMRLERAERLGLTYEEYTLEILERGRHLSEDDAGRVAAIKAGRKRRKRRAAVAA
jgi:hypothetical protein